MKNFKKPISLILSCLVAFNTTLLSFAEEKTETSEPNISITEDFEGEDKGFTKSGTSYSVVSAPEREGKALANQYTGKGRGTISKIYPESLPYGRYCLDFDYYLGDFSGDIQFQFNSKTQNAVPLAINTTGMLRVRRGTNWYFDGHLDRQLKINTWYNIKMWLDTENCELSIYLDDELLVRMNMPDERLKEFTGFQINNLNNGTKVGNAYLDNLKFYRVEDDKFDGMSPFYIDVKTAEDIIGNNFYKDNPPKFDFTYKNRLNKDVKAKIWYRAYTNQENKLIWTTEDTPEEITVEADGEITKTVLVGKEYFERMNLDIVIDTDEGRFVRTIPYTMSNHTKDMPHNKRCGVANHIAKNRSNEEISIPLQAAAGIGGLRDELILWMDVEKEKGVYNFTEKHDRRLDLVEEYDLFLMEQWANGNGAVYKNPDAANWIFPVSEEGLQGLTNFMEEMVKFADGRIDAIEVWNEFNNMSGPYKLQYQYEAAYHKALYEGVKKGDPNVLVSGFDTDGWGVNIHQEFKGTLEFLDGAKPFDVISLHPYNLKSGEPPERNTIRTLTADASRVLEGQGYDGDVDYYFTESGRSDDAYSFNGRKKASYITRSMAIPFVYDLAECYFVYNFHNYPELWDNKISEATFGITEAYCIDGAEVPYLGKEVYVALAYYNNLMAEAEVVSAGSTDGHDKDFVYHIKHRDGFDVLMFGPTDEDVDAMSFSFDLGCDSIIVGDMYGNERIMYGVNGRYDFNTTAFDIVYLKGNFSKVEIAEPVMGMSAYRLDIPVNYEFKISSSVPADLKASMYVTESNGVEVLEDRAEFKDGKAELTFKSLKESSDMASISVEIADGDKVYYSARIPLTYTSSGVVQGDFKWQLSGNRYDLWNLQMVIKNVRTDVPISGVFTFDGGQKYMIPTINPGETRRITIPNEKIVRRDQLGKISGRMDFNTGDYALVTQNNEQVAIPKIDTPPKIDGVLEEGEWITSPALSIKADAQSYVKGGTATWGGIDDLSYDAYFAYDTENIYIAARVKDDVHRNVQTPENLWDGDSLQMMIGFDEESQGTEYGVALLKDGPVCYRTLWEGALAGLADVHHKALFTDAEVAVKRSGTYTDYEIKIPWNKIHFDGIGIKPGQYIYFSIVANDDDNTTSEPLARNKNRDLFMEVVNCIAGGSKYNYQAVKTLLIP